jgi:hypothetical protein
MKLYIYVKDILRYFKIFWTYKIWTEVIYFLSPFRQIYLIQYGGQNRLPYFIEQVYNQIRLHSS